MIIISGQLEEELMGVVKLELYTGWLPGYIQ